MKLSVKILRVAHVPADQFRAAVGAEQTDHWTVVISKLKEHFGPVSPAVHFFKRDDGMVLAGVEAVGFDIKESEIPQSAGFVNADPLRKDEILRLDGQLLGELARIGIHTVAEQYEWRCFYEKKGN